MPILVLPSPRWRHLDRPDLDWANHFSDAIRRLERQDAEAVPDFAGAPRLFLFSDYAGDHTAFRTYSFLLVSDRALHSWRRRWEPIRDQLLPGGRHLEYKNLSYYHQRVALRPFLNGSDRMNGLLITFAVDQRIRTMFREDAEPEPREETILSAWSPAVDERLWRIAHFAALIVSGLARAGQSVWWFSDHDAIALHHDQKVAFWELWLRTLDTYGRGDLDDPRFTSKGKEPGTTPIRDLLAVPDLAAGALADILTEMTPGALPTQQLLAAVPRLRKPKATDILDWYVKPGVALRRLLCLCTATGAPGTFRSQWMTFTSFDGQYPSRLWRP